MKILIASVSCGAGHLRAAEAIETALRTSHPSAEVLHVNMMDQCSGLFRWFYEGGYTFLAKRAPWLWGHLYDLSDRDLLWPLTQRFANFIQRLQCGGFLNIIGKFRPDKIISTHFLAPQIMTALLLDRRFDVRMDVVVTDYGLHRFWMEPCVNRYYVAHPGVLEELARAGVSPDIVSVTGIPIDPVFSKDVNMESVRLKMNLDQTRPVVLVLSGGFGFGTLEKTVERLFQIGHPIQIVAVAGKNEILRQRIAALKPPEGIDLITLGYSKNMHELLSISDLIITKAGGLTVSEGLAKGVPMIFYGLLPGQEEKNARYVQDRDAGVLVDSLSDLLEEAKKILSTPSLLDQMKNNARKIARPNAAFDIAERALRSLGT